MHFKRIDMHGFKSFAEAVSVEFDRGITCIVGPNGSGKSNIADAVRWVLGEQSPKALRGGKMDEVIFAGTASRKSRGMAEVTIVIDNSDNRLPIEYNEVAITRRMYRSGESEYLINNNRCRLKDVKELIMDTGIGVDGYSLIGQGKIADIVSNKPESRREIFEEAAGIVMYRTRKAEAERKLASSNTNLDRVTDIISEIEGRIGMLKSDSEKATEFLKLKESLKTLEINITLKNIDTLELKAEYMKDDLTEIAVSIEALKEEKSGLDAGATENRARLENIEGLIEANNAKLLTLIADINETESRIHVDRERLTAIDASKDRLLGEIAAADGKLAIEAENLAALEHDRQATDEALQALHAELSERIAAFEVASALSDREAERIDAMKNEIYGFHGKAVSKRSEAESIKNLIGGLERRRDELYAERETAEAEQAQAEGARASADADVTALRAKQSGLSETLAETTRGHEEGLAARDRTQRTLEQLRLDIERRASRIKTIVEMEENYDGYNNAVKYIMKADVAGIRGVAAALMRVPAGYEFAIEAAMGASLQNIVCTDDRCAKQAIRLLKESKAGRLTFLPVQSIKGTFLKEEQLENIDGFVGYGPDCIEFDAEYENVFRYLLGRTVVANNMDNAIKLAAASKKGFRVVTLQGEIINPAGAITGGRYRNESGNLLGRKAEIERLTAELAQKQAEERQTAAAADEIRDRIEALSHTLTLCREESKETEIALLNAENRLSIACSVLDDLAESMDKYARELDSIAEESRKSADIIAALLKEAQEAEDAVADIEEKIDAAATNAQTQRTSLDAIGDAITELRMSVASRTEQRAGIDNMMRRIRETLAELESGKREKQSELDHLAAARTEITAAHENIDAVLAQKAEDKTYTESYGEELAQEKRTIAEAQAEQSQNKEQLDNKLSELQSAKYEIEIKQAKNETQLEHYKEKLWEEYEVTYIQAMEFRSKDFNMNASLKEAREIKAKIKDLGDVNVGAIKEYAEVGQRYEFLSEQRDDILEATAALKTIIDDMDRTIKARFKDNFDKVAVNFELTFQELFGGGHAQLRLDDENNPLEAGIEIIAQPPGKKLQNINLMSGGEKTMTAIALMFAVLKTKPTPFCILDEVEAALDDANITRFAQYLKHFDEIQFALVTHQRATMEYADVLYGVTMPEQGISKIISLKMGDDFAL